MRVFKWSIQFLFFIPVYLTGQVPIGPLNPSGSSNTACSISYGSTVPYAPANAIYVSDNVYATATHCACCDQNTNCLLATNFGFAIPTGATITGILVEIEKGTTSFNLQDNGLRLLKAGVEVGSDYAQFGTPWALADTYVTYGGCNDLWGTTWTPADINAAGFGLAFSSIDYSCSGTVASRIDHIRITVCYMSVLPVLVEYFKGRREKETVQLTWKTNLDEAFSSMALEYSADGATYQNLQSILPNERLLEGKTFSFIHPNTYTHTSYYRLKISQGADVKYSNSISIEPYDEIAPKLFPNPGNGLVTINGSVGSNYVLLNAIGEVLSNGYINEKEFKADFSSLPNGVYILKLEHAIYKLVIEH